MQQPKPPKRWREIQYITTFLASKASMNEEQQQQQGGGLPSLSDVILGRGRGHTRHPGNVYLRLSCDIYRPQYEQAVINKAGKARIINEIFALVRRTSRFLKQDAQTGLWSEVGDVAARRKIGQVSVHTM